MRDDLNQHEAFWLALWDHLDTQRQDLPHYFISPMQYTTIHHRFHRTVVETLTHHDQNALQRYVNNMQRTFTKQQYFVGFFQQMRGSCDPLLSLIHDFCETFTPYPPAHEQNPQPAVPAQNEHLIVHGLLCIFYGLAWMLSQLVCDLIQNIEDVNNDDAPPNDAWDRLFKGLYACMLTLGHHLFACFIPWVIYGVLEITQGIIDCLLPLSWIKSGLRTVISSWQTPPLAPAPPAELGR